MSQAFRYRGNLAENTLPEMLSTIDRFRVPGIVEARLDQIVKRVFVRDGYIIHASSSDLEDSLGHHLSRQGRISRQDLEKLTREMQSTNKRFGVLLIERGLLSPAQVLTALRQQIEAIVWSLFYWQEGEVAYGIGELKLDDKVQIQLPIGQVIVQGIRQAPDARPLIARIGRKETRLRPSFKVEDLIELGLEADEYKLLRMVDGKKTLYELCSAGPKSPADNAKLLYAFLVLHLIRPEGAEQPRTGRVKIRLRTTGDAFPG